MAPSNPCDTCPLKEELVTTAIATLKDIAPSVKQLAIDMKTAAEVGPKVTQLSTDMRWLTRGAFIFGGVLILLLLARAAFIDIKDIKSVSQVVTAAIP
jgi:hypothetical protein